MERNNGIVNLAANGATVIINGKERDTYCAPYGTEITWSVSKEGCIPQSGLFMLTRDITLDIELKAAFHFKYDNDTMTIVGGTARGVNDTGIFCIDGLWDIMINGTVLYAEGAETTTYGSEYLNSTDNDIYVVPKEGTKIYGGNNSATNNQGQYITEVLSWGDCEFGSMVGFFGSNRESLLKSVPAFTEGFKSVTNFSSCFYNCSGLTSLPTGLFDSCTEVTDFSYCFYNCTGMTSLPTGLFDNCTAVTNFGSCFYNCSGLTSLPTGLFDNCTAVTNFSYCFYGCSGLTSLPENLFANCTKVTNFGYCFYNCSGLTSLPTGLFDSCTAVTNFSSCFDGCEGLSSLPTGLFDNCTAVTNFSSCFNYCEGLSSLPTGLFDSCTEVTNFSYCFDYCRGLSSLPTGLFDSCTKVTDFSYCFNYCRGLGGESPYSTINGTKVHLYERCDYPDYFTHPDYYTGCFYECGGLDDYAQIPDNWKE